MGTQTIMYARMILVVANGEAKAQAVHDMCYGPVTPSAGFDPAAAHQLRCRCRRGRPFALRVARTCTST